jgi:hypothetical protein
MLGRMDEFIMCYGKGLEIQMVSRDLQVILRAFSQV